MSLSLRDLSPAELGRLGGLRVQCSAPLACAEHGAPHPCELCELEGGVALSCTACGHQFSQGLTEVMDRPCASGAEFASSGRIAFEAAAVAAFADEQAQKERDRGRELERTRQHEENDARARQQAQALREREQAERAARETRTRNEAERRRERADAERLAEQERVRAAEVSARVEAEGRRESLERSALEADGVGESRSQIAVLSSGVAALLGAIMAWRLPLLPLHSASWLYLILVYAPVVLMAWFLGATSLYGKDPAHRSLRWWSALPWAFFCFAWPALIGLGACHLISEIFSGGAYFKALLFVSLLGFVGISSMIYGGVTFSMEKPWPGGAVGHDFKGKRSWWLWVGVLLTLSLNVSLYQGRALQLPWADDTPKAVKGGAIAPLLPLVGMPSTSSSRGQTSGVCVGKPNPAECVRGSLGRSVKLSADDLRAAASQSLGQLAATVNAANDLSQTAAQTALPTADAAIKMLTELPKPVRGNRAAARALLNQGLALFNQKGGAAEAVVLLQRAHQTDPLDVQIVNDLAYVQMQAGQLKEAEENLLKALMLSPKRTSGWGNLAQLRILSAPGDARAIDEAARYLLVAYWYSTDREKTVNYFKEQAKAGDGSTPFAEACKRALKQIGISAK